MTDHYAALGVPRTATAAEIKQAFRKLASQHHPDKGGDTAKFQSIQAAYAVLGDEQKRAEYDQQRRFGGGPQVRFHTGNFNDINDIFGAHFGGANPFGDIFGHQRGMRRNRDLNIQCQISLLDSYQGKQLEAQYKLPSGRTQTVVINVPAGIEHGSTIRYQGLGDDGIPNVARGDLNVTIIVVGDPDHKFERRGFDLYTTVEITPIEAMIGCRKTVYTITGNPLELEIRPGVESGLEYASAGQGFPIVQNNGRGRFVSVIKIKTPTVIDPILVKQLRDLDALINT